MLRTLLLRSSPFAAAVVSVGSAARPTRLDDSPADLEKENTKVMEEVLKLSEHKTLKDLQAAGEKRRAESGCSFCKWMVEGPCGKPVYVDWDDCVHETKQIEGRNFVEVCRPFTLALMTCIAEHPDYYEELAKMEKESDSAKESEAGSQEKDLGQEWEWKAAASDMGQRKDVLTAQAPGPWRGKELSHVPVVVSSGGRCAVSVPHPSRTPEHWIQWVWAQDNATGAVVAVKKFAPNEAPEITFDVPAGVASVTAFESCNLHGIWKTDPVKMEK